MYRVEVNTYGDPAGTWTGNMLRFVTIDEAVDYADALFVRWTAVRYWRVVDDETNAVLREGP